MGWGRYLMNIVNVISMWLGNSGMKNRCHTVV